MELGHSEILWICVLGFYIDRKTCFEIPLNHGSQCITSKKEITMEAADLDPVEAFQKEVMNKATVISVSGNAIAIFREIQCLTPR
ncbi:Ssrp [Trypoxylus dichotomus]